MQETVNLPPSGIGGSSPPLPTILTISLKVELSTDNRKTKERYLHGPPFLDRWQSLVYCAGLENRSTRKGYRRFKSYSVRHGVLAHLARAIALQAIGEGFESLRLHHLIFLVTQLVDLSLPHG